MKNLILTITTLFILNSGIIHAQSPDSFNYQSVVRDNNGMVLANQSVGMQISILQGSTNGTAVYTETFAPTSNNYGLVNLEIGTGTTTDNFNSIDWANGPFFVNIAVDFSGGTNYADMGTSQLISVPYALYASEAANVPQNTSDLNNDSGFITNPDDADADPTNEVQTISKSGNTVTLSNSGGSFTDDVDDADADPTNEIQVIVSADAGNTITAGVDGGAYLASSGDADWTVSGNDQYSGVSGNVGIGTTTPATKLDVNGDITLSESPNDEMVIINDDIWEHGSGNQDFGDGGDHFIMASRETAYESAGIYGDGDHVTIWSPGDGAIGQPAALIYVNDEDFYNGATDSDPFNNNAMKAYLNTSGNWVAASDKNKKENIVKLDNSLEKLGSISGYSYNFILADAEIEKGDTAETTYGVIAQEVYKTFPEVVDIAADGSHYVCYTEFIPILINAVNEQQELIKDYEEEIQEVKNENAQLKEKLKSIEERLQALETKEDN